MVDERLWKEIGTQTTSCLSFILSYFYNKFSLTAVKPVYNNANKIKQNCFDLYLKRSMAERIDCYLVQ